MATQSTTIPPAAARPKREKKATKKTRQPKSPKVQSIELLPFVRTRPKKGTGRDWWVTPDLSEDLAQIVGEGFAREWLRFTRRYESDGSSFMLCSVIESMVKAGRWGAVEHGFVSTIALALNGRVA